jgi:hypothetical protein
MFSVWFLVVFLCLFPKGGIKLGYLPLTWGYLYMALSAFPLLLVRVLMLPLRFPTRLLAALGMIAPIQVLCIYTACFYGIVNASYAMSTFTGLIFLPWIFLLIYPPFFSYIDGQRLAKYLRICILFAAIWGIFLFIWHPLTGKFIEIPYFTVNAADFGEIERTKHIARGLFLKLISTYNNGNLYGVCMLILLPLYTLLEPKRWRRATLQVALFLTLSRAVWAGMIANELFSIVLLLLRQVNTFPRVFLGGAGKRIAALAMTIFLVFASLLFNENSVAFLFDPQLGGRSELFGIFSTATLLPTHGLFGLQEILYLSAADQFGWVGAAAFLLMMASPFLLLLVDPSALQSPYRRAALRGLLLYSFMGCIDGGFNYIPTMAIYWFAYMIYLFGWPAAHPVSQEQPTALTAPLDPATA